MQGTRMAAVPVDDARRPPHLAPSCASGAAAVLPVDANGRYTADEFMALPLDLKRYELVRGRLVEVPVTSFKHGVIEINIVLLLGQHVRQRRLGQLTPGDAKHLLARDPDTLRQPDVAFVRAERLPPPDEWEAYGQVVPDLAVEILSPSNTAAEMRDKVAEYGSAGDSGRDARQGCGVPAGRRCGWCGSLTGYEPEVDGDGDDPYATGCRVCADAPVILSAGDEITGGDVLPDFRCPVAPRLLRPGVSHRAVRCRYRRCTPSPSTSVLREWPHE